MVSMMKLSALVCFWMFSPEALVLVGNAAGYGWIQSTAVMLILTLIIVYGVYLFHVSDVREKERRELNGSGWERFLSILGFAGIWGTTIFASTGILVTAGFTFNEVFYYRFPNFGFAFLLLGAALAMQYLSDDHLYLFIGGLVSMVILCIVLLIVYALLTYIPKETVFTEVHNSKGSFSTALSLIFIFLGFEQIGSRLSRKFSVFEIAAVLIFAAMLICGWMFVSARLVESERLVTSTIPHMTVAGKLLSPFGRYVMGVVVICGSLSAVSTFFVFSRIFLVERNLAPLLSGSAKEVAIVPALVIALLLLLGFAGTGVLEHLISVSFLLWMGYGGVLLIRRALCKRQKAALVGVLLGGIIILCSFLAVLRHNTEMYLKMLPVFLCIAALCVIFLTTVRTFLGRKAA